MNGHTIITGLMLLQVYVDVSYASVEQGAQHFKIVSTFECRSNNDIKFQFVHETANKTRQTIAECETTIQTCYLQKQSLGKFYAVFYTGKTVVLEVEEPRGSYYCCETYQTNNCIQLDIGPLENNIPQTKPAEVSEPSSDIATIRTCVVVLCVAVMVGLLLYSINFAINCKKGKLVRIPCPYMDSYSTNEDELDYNRMPRGVII